MTKTQTARNMI